MYPETDVPLQDISIERWEAICSNLPLSSDERLQRLFELDISHNQAESVLNGELDDILFEGIEEILPFQPRLGQALYWNSELSTSLHFQWPSI